MPASDGRESVIVAGDVTIDWNIACAGFGRSSTNDWIEERRHTRAYWQRGGAALLADLIEGIAARLAQTGATAYRVYQTAVPKERVAPEDPRFHHAYKQWLMFPYSKQSANPHPPVWRLGEWLGMSRTTGASQSEWAQVVDDTPDAELVVLSDASLDFREQRELWPLALQLDAQPAAVQPWVLLKMSRPVAQGALWEHLHRHFAEP